MIYLSVCTQGLVVMIYLSVCTQGLAMIYLSVCTQGLVVMIYLSVGRTEKSTDQVIKPVNVEGAVQVGGQHPRGRGEGHAPDRPHADDAGLRPPRQPPQLRQARPASGRQHPCTSRPTPTSGSRRRRTFLTSSVGAWTCRVRTARPRSERPGLRRAWPKNLLGPIRP